MADSRKQLRKRSPRKRSEVSSSATALVELDFSLLERRDYLASLLGDIPGYAKAAELRNSGSQTSSSLFYDYVQNGQLQGGRVDLNQVDPGWNQRNQNLRFFQQGWNVQTLYSSGPSSNRVDIVFVGDGYTSAQLPKYASDVNNTLPVFFGEAPLNEYKSFFNVHRVDVVSNESGVDNDPTQGIQKDTALGMGYWGYGIERLLIIDTAKAELAAGNAPDVDQILALANSTKYGGAGYAANNLGTYAGGNGSAIEVALHEFGHSFADLADEYDYGDGARYTGGEFTEPNVSIKNASQISSSQSKWQRWLDLANVDSFEGAAYNQFGAFRPTANSKMRSLDRPFEEVNIEQFVVSAYKTVRPIDSATPAGSYPVTQLFSVDPVDPIGHALNVQWYLNDQPVSGATGLNFNPQTLGLSAGTYNLSVKVVDNTPLVRDPALRNTWLSEQRSWSLVVVVNQPPAISSFGNAVTYRENAVPLPISNTAVVTDTDSPNFGGGRMEVRLASGAETADHLSVRSTPSMTVSPTQISFAGLVVANYSGGNGSTPLVINFNNFATLNRVQHLLRNVVFQTNSDNPSSSARQLKVNLSDGQGGNAPEVAKAVNVLPVNDRPILGGISGTLNYAQNAGGILIASAATVSDPDNVSFAGGVLTVKLTAGQDLSNRILVSGNFSFDANNNLVRSGVIVGSRKIHGGIGLTDLELTFNGQATRSMVEELLRTLRFRTVNGTNFQQRRIEFTLTDGSGGTSNTVNRLVNVL